MSDLPKPAAAPCGSCPYRKDVPSGVWAQEEYDKLPGYDGEIIEQLVSGNGGLFMCHQRDGCLCSGWLACHGPDNLLALRIAPVDPSAYDYTTKVEVFASGAEARAHGMRDIPEPTPEARRLIGKVERRIKSVSDANEPKRRKTK
jgi:hypothetical protein